MDMHKLQMHRAEKDHQMRHGHVSDKDRNDMAQFMPHRYGFLDKEDKQYHSPEHVETMEQEPKPE